MNDELKERYVALLKEYMAAPDELILYEVGELSKAFIQAGIAPEDVVGLHVSQLKEMFPHLDQRILRSFSLLIEVMVGYGFQYREHESLLEKQMEIDFELEVAAGMQRTLLPQVPAHIPEIDLGFVSVAAKEMSGDYYYFNYQPDKSSLAVAVADIIGKGIPAALSMSMIKYAIESLVEHGFSPNVLLENINRVVEKNIHRSMFITMIYGVYDLTSHRFCYATAGHEPPLYYSHKDKACYDLPFKGLVLGLWPDVHYRTFQQNVSSGDMLILFSDGVTESERKGEFINRRVFADLIVKWAHLPAQEMVDEIQQTLLRWSNFHLKDDQTILVLKRP